MRASPLPQVDGCSLGCIDGELDQLPIGVLDIDRDAETMVHVHVGDAGFLQARPDAILGLLIGLHCQVHEQRLLLRGIDLLLLRVGEVEERQGGSVGKAVEGMAVGVRHAVQFVLLDPEGDERHAQHVFVEMARTLLIGADVGRVVQTAGLGLHDRSRLLGRRKTVEGHKGSPIGGETRLAGAGYALASERPDKVTDATFG